MTIARRTFPKSILTKEKEGPSPRRIYKKEDHRAIKQDQWCKAKEPILLHFLWIKNKMFLIEKGSMNTSKQFKEKPS